MPRNASTSTAPRKRQGSSRSKSIAKSKSPSRSGRKCTGGEKRATQGSRSKNESETTVNFQCSCQCGKVHLSVAGVPQWSAWCHARVLRAVHGAPMVGLAGYTSTDVSVTKGSKNVLEYESEKDGCTVVSCKTCGSGLFADIYGLGMGVYIQSFASPESANHQRGDGVGYDPRLAPTSHFYYAEGNVSCFDGLPKFATLPSSLGGEEKLLDEGIHGPSKPSEERDCALEFPGLCGDGLDSYADVDIKDLPVSEHLDSFRAECHCGALQVSIKGTPDWAANCHCSLCRRLHSSPFVALAGYRDECVVVVKGSQKMKM